MNKRLGFYTAVWTVVLALFNIIAFAVPAWPNYEKFTASFWIGYVLIMLVFGGHFACAYMIFREENTQRLFYKLSLIKICYIALVSSFVIGGLCMIISPLPPWIGAILCVAVFALNVLAAVKATAAVFEVERIDEKIRTQTFYMRSLTVDADTLMKSARSETVKAECRKVYEAIRYSDPMSCAELETAEAKISVKFGALTEAVKDDNADAVTALAEELLVLVSDRNQKCKLFK